MDTFSRQKRSEIMASVRSTGNRSTEAKLRGILVRAGLRSWKLQRKELPGSPDVVFPRRKLAVFVDGCFWHGCSRCYRRPKSSRDYWDAKVARNIARDRRVDRDLRRLGWTPVRLWEHQVAKEPAACLERLRISLRKAAPALSRIAS